MSLMMPTPVAAPSPPKTSRWSALDDQHPEDEGPLGATARRVPISRTRSNVAITIALLMITSATRKMTSTET